MSRQEEAHASLPRELEIDDESFAEDNAIYLEVVGIRNKKGNVYGLGQLSEEFVASSSQLSTQNNLTPAVDYVMIIAARNTELAKKQAIFEQKVAETVAKKVAEIVVETVAKKVAEEKAKMEQKFDERL